MKLRRVLATLLILQFCVSGIAQQPSRTPASAPAAPVQAPQQPPKQTDDDVVRITTNLVQVDAVITDGKGRLVTDLAPEELDILEDGESQKITHLSFVSLESSEVKPANPLDRNAAPVPPVRLRPDQVRRTMAIVVDDLGLSYESSYFVRQALKSFVEKQIQPDDLVAIIRTGGGIGALQQFTSDKRQLYAAAEKVKWNPNSRAGISVFSPFAADVLGPW